MGASRAGKTYAMVVVAILLLKLDLSQGTIQVLPNSEDRSIVLNGATDRFVKRCNYTGSGNLDSWQWFRNEDSVTENIVSQGTLSVLSFFPSTDNEGSYRCQALDNQMNVLASADVGTLTVRTPEDIVSLIPVQYVGRGEDIVLTCSSTVPGTSIFWRKGSADEPVDNQVYSITNAAEADEGIYTCNVFKEINGENIAQRSLQLYVLIFPNITRIPGDMTLGNEQVTLEVEFESSFGNTTTVNWFKDGNRLTRNLSTETYTNNDEKGISRLPFDPAQRSDSGVYTVEIFNENNNIPTDRRNVFSEPFTITVRVPPITPGRPTFSVINATTTLIRWTLPTSSSPDAAPDHLQLELTSNHSQSQIQLPPNTTEILVNTEPGVFYMASITSFNVDDTKTSEPATLFTTPSAPGVSDILIHRVNQTTFNVTVLVLFTGHGPSASLKLVDVEYRDMLGGVGGWLPIEPSIPLVRDATDMSRWSVVIMREGFTHLRMVEFMFRIQNDRISDTTINQRIEGVSVPPGQPVILNGTLTATSLYIVARLSSEGTSPLSTLHTVIAAAGHPTRVLTKNDSLAVGEEVGVLITSLTPDVSYTVYVYVDNVAGRSPQSPQRIFTTASKATDFPVWLIALVAIVSSCILVALTLVILISCYCKRHGKQEQKINLSAESGTNGVRQMPLGATGCSIDKVPSFSGYSTISVADDSKFNLEPPPQGHSTGHNSVFSSLVHEPYSNSRSNYIYPTTKPRPHAGSFSGSDLSDHSATKYFQYRQSPAHRSFITEDQLSHSMPVLEDADLTPTMPPNCSTDV